MSNTYPLKLSFKLLALAPRLSVTDATGKEIFYIEQKVFALKEAVKVFNNSQEKNLLYTIKADQILDFSAQYHFRTPDESIIGSVKQEGLRSLFRASFKVFDSNDQELFKIMQSNPWIGMLDSIINIIPFAELVTGFILNPVYAATTKDANKQVMQMKKKPSFFEAQFTITKTDETLSEEQELLLLLSLLMIVQLERNRG